MSRICPFCKEDIKEDAIKCRYCHSLLYKIETDETTTPEKPKNASNFTTYILDKDLIRFAKFSLSLLAIFITTGLVLYGVDLKATANDLKVANTNLEEGNKKSPIPCLRSTPSNYKSITCEVK